MNFDQQLRQAVDALNDRLLDGHRQAVDEAVASARAETRPTELAASQRLLDAVRSIGRACTLSEILDTLLNCAAGEASRAAVLLARGEILSGWRFIGFGSAFRDAHAIEVGRDEGGVVTEVMRSGAAASGDSGAPRFAELAPGNESCAVPLVVGGQIVAVLYADHGTGELWTDSLEILAQHAARCLEAITATKAARALTDCLNLPPAGAKITTAPDRDGGRNEEEHASARRYARLLVSEIKLYHEVDVVAGIQERDLGLRLGGEIVHARSLYEQRVPPDVRQQSDYFHEELVRTLANGDGALLEVKT